LLAHHLTAAGNTERAVEQWLKAGQHPAARLAYLEAIAHLERGLGQKRQSRDWTRRMPPASHVRRRRDDTRHIAHAALPLVDAAFAELQR